MTLEGKRALIVGLGKSGQAAAGFLARNGAKVAVTDRLPLTKLTQAADALAEFEVDLLLGRELDGLTEDRDLVVVSPGVDWKLPELERARERGVEVVGELEIAQGRLLGKVIGVTGTNGKTTTTALIGHILRSAWGGAGGSPVQVAGNIGEPVLSIIESSVEETWNVLELSSFQLEATSSFHVDIAVVLNVTADHLDRHGTIENYAALKERILQAQQANDYAVLNADDPICRGFAGRAAGECCWFSRSGAAAAKTAPGAWVENGQMLFNGEPAGSVDLPIRGAHNLENALAAVAAAGLAGVAPNEIAAAVQTFSPIEHRLEFVAKIAGVDYYNDSKATNVDSAIKAVEAFDRGVWVILGGSEKGVEYDALAKPLAERARGVLLIGAAAEAIARAVGKPAAVFRCGTLAGAVAEACRRAEPGDTVLLAPACASFDQFDDYEHRGREFKRLVAALEEDE